ncbi:hypothetical protein GALMADRAFT_241957 [Galerina marginata CBS 339.88]|uniref:Uncharacterized protein n=1 Tax=Galerina marginata (strain CBS 339.88) TaxID=685588 RepID=A0A067T9P9_GALM3|nr:hypothetical protein GALMADRAFT_241957 [Galerina marginata CBS 339.88]
MRPFHHVIRWYNNQQPTKKIKIKAALLSLAFTTVSGVTGTLYDSAPAKRASVFFGILAGLIALWITIWEPPDNGYTLNRGAIHSQIPRHLLPLPSIASRPHHHPLSTTFLRAISSFIPPLIRDHGLHYVMTNPPHVLRNPNPSSILMPYMRDQNEIPIITDEPAIRPPPPEKVISNEHISSVVKDGSPQSIPLALQVLNADAVVSAIRSGKVRVTGYAQPF